MVSVQASAKALLGGPLAELGREFDETCARLPPHNAALAEEGGGLAGAIARPLADLERATARCEGALQTALRGLHERLAAFSGEVDGLAERDPPLVRALAAWYPRETHGGESPALFPQTPPLPPTSPGEGREGAALAAADRESERAARLLTGRACHEGVKRFFKQYVRWKPPPSGLVDDTSAGKTSLSHLDPDDRHERADEAEQQRLRKRRVESSILRQSVDDLVLRQLQYDGIPLTAAMRAELSEIDAAKFLTEARPSKGNGSWGEEQLGGASAPRSFSHITTSLKPPPCDGAGVPQDVDLNLAHLKTNSHAKTPLFQSPDYAFPSPGVSTELFYQEIRRGIFFSDGGAVEAGEHGEAAADICERLVKARFPLTYGWLRAIEHAVGAGPCGPSVKVWKVPQKRSPSRGAGPSEGACARSDSVCGAKANGGGRGAVVWSEQPAVHDDEIEKSPTPEYHDPQDSILSDQHGATAAEHSVSSATYNPTSSADDAEEFLQEEEEEGEEEEWSASGMGGSIAGQTGTNTSTSTSTSEAFTDEEYANEEGGGERDSVEQSAHVVDEAPRASEAVEGSAGGSNERSFFTIPSLYEEQPSEEARLGASSESLPEPNIELEVNTTEQSQESVSFSTKQCAWSDEERPHRPAPSLSRTNHCCELGYHIYERAMVLLTDLTSLSVLQEIAKIFHRAQRTPGLRLFTEGVLDSNEEPNDEGKSGENIPNPGLFSSPAVTGALAEAASLLRAVYKSKRMLSLRGDNHTPGDGPPDDRSGKGSPLHPGTRLLLSTEQTLSALAYLSLLLEPIPSSCSSVKNGKQNSNTPFAHGAQPCPEQAAEVRQISPDEITAAAARSQFLYCVTPFLLLWGGNPSMATGGCVEMPSRGLSHPVSVDLPAPFPLPLSPVVWLECVHDSLIHELHTMFHLHHFLKRVTRFEVPINETLGEWFDRRPTIPHYPENGLSRFVYPISKVILGELDIWDESELLPARSHLSSSSSSDNEAKASGLAQVGPFPPPQAVRPPSPPLPRALPPPGDAASGLGARFLSTPTIPASIGVFLERIRRRQARRPRSPRAGEAAASSGAPSPASLTANALMLELPHASAVLARCDAQLRRGGCRDFHARDPARGFASARELRRGFFACGYALHADGAPRLLPAFRATMCYCPVSRRRCVDALVSGALLERERLAGEGGPPRPSSPLANKSLTRNLRVPLALARMRGLNPPDLLACGHVLSHKEVMRISVPRRGCASDVLLLVRCPYCTKETFLSDVLTLTYLC